MEGNMPDRRAFLKGVGAVPFAVAFAGPAFAQPQNPSTSLTAMLGDYPHSHALHAGAVNSARLQLDIAPVSVPATAFARTVAMEFDVSELSLVTFLQAKTHGRRLVLVPAVYLSRFQHPFLLYNSARGTMAPKDLEGARVGVRLFTATTPSWTRGILADDYGVDISKIQWRAWQKPNVPEWRDPPNVTMIPEPAQTSELGNMLLRGEVDAIVLEPVPNDPRIKSVIPDPAAAARAWSAKHRGAIQINHMVVVKEELTRSRPDAIRELYRMLVEAKRVANEAVLQAAFTPFGLEANRNNIEVVIDYAFRTGMIPRRFTVDELFNDMTASLV
jgi:4,5-dihydroxyphthalate decarboxylase